MTTEPTAPAGPEAGSPPSGGDPPRRGIRASAQRVVAHARALARLERELAQAELQRKGGMVGGGVALAIGAAVLSLFAVGFGLATLTAALALVVDWWLALLIVFLFLLAVVVGLGLGARSLIRAATPVKPVQALEEAQLTKEALRGARGE
ncbi:MAG: phage holin family protein [Gaiellaceae bacterium]